MAADQTTPKASTRRFEATRPAVRHPTWTPANAVVKRQLEAALGRAAAEHAEGRLVDVGCGLKPYAGIFAPYVTEHVGVDHPDSPHAATSVDVLACAYHIPLSAGSFDTALLSEVLEHLERPADALREVLRLLRPGGKIILTTPFIWPLHEEPRDYFRFTPHGLRYLLLEAGFDNVDVVPLSGQWVSTGVLSAYAMRRSQARRLGRLLSAYLLVRGRVGEHLDTRRPQPWMSWNHLAVAQRVK